MVGRRGAPTAGSATGRSCWATTDLRGFHGHSHRRTGHPERADEGRAAHWQPRPRRISRRAVCHQGQRTMVRWRPRRRTRTPYWAGELGHATGGLGLGPLKRHQERWWDGHAWTTRVSDDNSVTVDDGPLPAGIATRTSSRASTAALATRSTFLRVRREQGVASLPRRGL